MKVFLLKGQSQYNVQNNVQRYFIDQIADGFKELGCDITIVDLMDSNWNDEFKNIKSYPDTLIYSFNGIGTDIPFLRDYTFFTHYVDHPFHHTSRILNHNPNTICGLVDRRHNKFVESYLTKNFNYLFLPHGACNNIKEIENVSNKEYDIFFSGSIWNLESLDDRINTLSNSERKIVKKLIDRQLYDNSLNIDERLELIKQEMPSYFKDNKLKDIVSYIYLADTYVRSKRRLLCINALADKGFKLFIAGSGWTKDLVKGDVTISDALDFYDTFTIAHKSKFSLNILPCFADGSHERVFTYILNKIPVISDTSIYLKEEFEDVKDIIYYSWDNNFEDLADKINTTDTSSIIQNGYNKVKDIHTWKDRAQSILDYIK